MCYTTFKINYIIHTFCREQRAKSGKVKGKGQSRVQFEKSETENIVMKGINTDWKSVIVQSSITLFDYPSADGYPSAFTIVIFKIGSRYNGIE